MNRNMGARDGALMKPKQTAKTTTLVDKMSHEGPVTLTVSEKRQLQKAFSDLTQANLGLTRMVNGLAEALNRHNLQVTPTENQDGSIGFDLQLAESPKAGDEPVTLN